MPSPFVSPNQPSSISASSMTRPSTGRPKISTPRHVRPRTLRPGAGRRDGALDGRGFDAARAIALTPLDEVRALDALFFAELPVPTVLELEVPGCAGPVWLRSAPGPGAAIGAPVIDGPLWRALATAVASERVRPIDFRALVEALGRASSTANSTRAGHDIIADWMDEVPPTTCRLRVGQVIERLGAKLFSVRVEQCVENEPAANGPAFAHAG